MAFMPKLMSKLNSLKNIINIKNIKNIINIKNIKNINRNTILIGIAVVAVVVTGILIFVNVNHGFTFPTIFGMSDSQLGKKAVDYINNNQLSATPASLVSVSRASGLVKVKIKIGTSEFDSYVTKDGKLLFPQAFDMTPPKASTNDANSNKTTPASIKKTDKPLLEAFVVSSCPFGLQMQRAVADAVKNIPSLASNIAIRYIGSISNGVISAMHGPEEAQENLRQICIREEQPAKYYGYISCYMKKTTSTAAGGMPMGDSTGCQASAGVNTASLNTCVSNPSKGLVYAKKDFDLADKYNISGSPTLVLDGVVDTDDTILSSLGGRSSDGVKSMVCAGFNSQPSFCSTKLNTAEAAASFSVNYSSASGSTGSTNCATAQ
jgi:hypothetical protein